VQTFYQRGQKKISLTFFGVTSLLFSSKNIPYNPKTANLEEVHEDEEWTNLFDLLQLLETIT